MWEREIANTKILLSSSNQHLSSSVTSRTSMKPIPYQRRATLLPQGTSVEYEIRVDGVK